MMSQNGGSHRKAIGNKGYTQECDDPDDEAAVVLPSTVRVAVKIAAAFTWIRPGLPLV